MRNRTYYLLTALFLALCLCLTLAACDGGEGDVTTPTLAPTDAPTDAPTEAPTAGDVTTEVPTEEVTTEEETTEEETEAPTQEIQTAAPVVDDEKEGGCGSIISVTSALVAIIALGAVCIKKRD